MDDARQKILVIDDSEIIREQTKLLLEEHGYEVVPLDTPIAAFLMVAQHMPHAVLVDFNMASLTGDHVVRSIKRSGRAKSVCVLLFSDRPESELRRVTDQCGADGFLPKSLDPQAFIARLRSYLAAFDARAEN